MGDVLQSSGLPTEAVEVIRRLVAGAGYDIEDPGDLTMGMTAVMATLRVCDALRTRRVPRGERVGRNDPCPCGSGKKHKKCCLKADGAVPGPERYDPGDPLDRVDLVPRLHDPEALTGDLAGLEALFLADDTLCKIRFTADKLMAFVMSKPVEEASPPPVGDPEEEDLGGEKRVSRYLREVEGIKALGNLDKALLRAARDSATCDQHVRSLAAGLALTEMESIASEDPGDAPNPLLNMLFWLTLREIVAGFSGIGNDLRELFPDGEFTASGLAERPAQGAELARRLEARGDRFLDAIRPAGEAAYRALIERIAAGEFPVGLPLLSALPALVRLSLLGLQEPRPEEFVEGLRAGAAALGIEDAELFDQALAMWVEDNRSTASSEDLTAIAQVRMDTAAGSFGCFDQALVVAAVKHQSCFSLRGEPEFPDHPVTQPSELFSSAYVEACGDFLQDCDLPEMAVRTWQLCELLGPVSEAVAGKVAALQQNLAVAEIPC